MNREAGTGPGTANPESRGSGLTGASIGADIVDLSLADPQKSLLPSFYSKILSGPEHTLRPSCLCFHNFLWLCWSVKESAYKFQRRLQPDLRFGPTKIVLEACHFSAPHLIEGDCFLSQVRINERRLFAISWVGDFVFTVAQEREDFSETIFATQHIPHPDPTPEMQSEAVRRLTLREMQSHFPYRDWQIKSREDGCPSLLSDGIIIPVSFSHHGCMIGFAAPQPPMRP